MKNLVITLDKLEQSPSNVRRTPSEAGINEMKASILAHGLMQNLVVKGVSGKFQVVSGARRLIAMKALAKEKKIPETFQVNCQLLETEDATEMSLVENVVREAMHPADEYEAFAALIKDKKLTIAQVALRFGCTENHVEQRLKLGRVASELMTAFRKDKLSLKSLMAFTLTDDFKKQLSVFKSLRGWEVNSDRAIRDKLTNRMYKKDDAKVKFIGMEAYKKAGGKIRADLFSENSYLEDGGIVEKLVTAKINDHIEKLKKEGWGFVQYGEDSGYTFRSKFTDLDKKPKTADLPKCGIYFTLDYSGKIDSYMLMKGKQSAEALKKVEKKKSSGMSEALRQDLASYRGEAIQVEIANSPNLAFDMLAFQMVTSVNRTYYSQDVFASVEQKRQTPTKLVNADATTAKTKFKEISKIYDLSWQKEKSEADKFKAFRKLSYENRLAQLAFAFSQSVHHRFADKNSQLSAYEVATSLLAYDLYRYWRPSKANYFQRITVDQLDKIGKEIFGKDWKPKALTKSILVKMLDEAFKDPKKHSNSNAETQKKLETWLPSGMSFFSAVDSLKKKAA